MTQEEFNYQTERLCNLYDKKLNAEQLGFWFKCLENTDIASYRRAIGEYAKKNKYMPTISDILTEIKNLKLYEQPKKEVVECKACKGSGYVLYKKIVNGIPYEYAALCNCSNSSGKEYSNKETGYYIPKATDVFKIGG